MASALALSLSVSTTIPRHHITLSHSTPHKSPLFAGIPKHNHRRIFKSLSSSPSSEPLVVSHISDPLRTGRFLSSEDLDKLRLLEGFVYTAELKSGSLSIRAMREDETDETVALLAESFAESMLLPRAYISVLEFLVKKYLIERRDVVPHAVTLLGFFRERKDDEEEREEDEGELAGTVEVCFDERGANVSPPTPTAPRKSPYISNMSVKEDLRRRGIGWHLLKAAEEIISEMSLASEVYLHCRMIDTAPFNMYTKAGYNVVKTDNIFVLMMLQRRKHLMLKKLPVRESPDEEGLT